MTEEINKDYVAKYVDRAESASSEQIRNDCLYRAGTQMEVLPCDGNANLTAQQQEEVLQAANKLLGGDA